MSIMIIDNEVYERVATKMFYSSFNTTCNNNYFYCCTKLSEDEIKIHVKTWLQLNEWSYVCAYGARLPDEKYESLCSLLYLDFKFPEPDSYQFLKWLHAIQYNIEIDTISANGWSGIPGSYTVTEQDLQSFEFLQNLILEVAQAIIKSLPEYDSAAWANVDEKRQVTVRPLLKG